MKDSDYGERVMKPLGQGVDYLINLLMTKPTVESVDIISNQILNIKRKRNYSDIVLYIVDAYSLGIGATLEIITKNPSVNCIVVLSNWNQYTGEAKEFSKTKGIGLFTFCELMGAVYYEGKKFIEYSPHKDDDEKRKI